MRLGSVYWPAVLAVFADTASAGIIQRRAPLSQGQLVNELSNLNGRDFCFAYINAVVLVLPDLVSTTSTKTILKTTRVRETSSSTETIGTLRKGTTTELETTTTTETGTATHTATATSTVVATTTVYFVHTTTQYQTVTRAVEVPPEDHWWWDDNTWSSILGRIRRRQALPTPEAIVDSDPLSISAACTKVVNKYPIYETAVATTTKLATTTDTTTATSTLVKTKFATHIIPYATRSTTVTETVGRPTKSITTFVQQSETTTTSVSSFTTVTEGSGDRTTIHATGTPDMAQYCQPTNYPSMNPQFVDRWHAVSTDPASQFQVRSFTYNEAIPSEEAERACCVDCYMHLFHYLSTCVGWIYDSATRKCDILHKRIDGPHGSFCPLKRIGFTYDPEGPREGMPIFRSGPCSIWRESCTAPGPETCYADWATRSHLDDVLPPDSFYS